MAKFKISTKDGPMEVEGKPFTHEINGKKEKFFLHSDGSGRKVSHVDTGLGVGKVHPSHVRNAQSRAAHHVGGEVIRGLISHLGNFNDDKLGHEKFGKAIERARTNMDGRSLKKEETSPDAFVSALEATLDEMMEGYTTPSRISKPDSGKGRRNYLHGDTIHDSVARKIAHDFHSGSRPGQKHNLNDLRAHVRKHLSPHDPELTHGNRFDHDNATNQVLSHLAKKGWKTKMNHRDNYRSMLKAPSQSRAKSFQNVPEHSEVDAFALALEATLDEMMGDKWRAKNLAHSIRKLSAEKQAAQGSYERNKAAVIANRKDSRPSRFQPGHYQNILDRSEKIDTLTRKELARKKRLATIKTRLGESAIDEIARPFGIAYHARRHQEHARLAHAAHQAHLKADEVSRGSDDQVTQWARSVNPEELRNSVGPGAASHVGPNASQRTGYYRRMAGLHAKQLKIHAQQHYAAAEKHRQKAGKK